MDEPHAARRRTATSDITTALKAADCHLGPVIAVPGLDVTRG